MYINTGYLNHSHKDFKDKSRPLIVGSCGTYRLSQHPKMPTYRPRGRLDYQIIYISSGLVHFHFDNPENETIIPAGHIVLFRTKELQKYEFYGKDKTDILASLYRKLCNNPFENLFIFKRRSNIKDSFIVCKSVFS